jgi:hypothetical protein
VNEHVVRVDLRNFAMQWSLAALLNATVVVNGVILRGACDYIDAIPGGGLFVRVRALLGLTRSGRDVC